MVALATTLALQLPTYSRKALVKNAVGTFQANIVYAKGTMIGVAQQHHWYQSVRKVLSLLSAKEVKTPLSFFFRLSSLIAGLVLLGVFVVPPSERVYLFGGAGILVLLLAVIVAAIAWNRPRNLVYGESGYRAETRLSLGTEREQIDADQLAALPRTSNPSSADIVVSRGDG